MAFAASRLRQIAPINFGFRVKMKSAAPHERKQPTCKQPPLLSLAGYGAHNIDSAKFGHRNFA
jgi:hypothetical protein